MPKIDEFTAGSDNFRKVVAAEEKFDETWPGGGRMVYEHDAFGSVSITESSGDNTTLFGSGLKHRRQINIKVSRAKGFRDLSESSHHATEVICEFALSPLDWAMLIASKGNYEGVPCTFRAYRTGPYHLPPQVAPQVDHTAEQFREEVRKKLKGAMSTYNNALKGVRELVANPDSVTKTQLREVLKTLEGMQNLESNLSFVNEQFNEALIKQATHTKNDILAFAHKHGLTADAVNTQITHNPDAGTIEAPAKPVESLPGGVEQ
jgi:hypothetical protein